MKGAWPQAKEIQSLDDRTEVEHAMPVAALLAAMFVLLALPPSNLWTMLLMALGVVLALIAPSFSIALVIMSVPVQEALLLPYVRGDLTLTQIAVMSLAVGWGLSFWRRQIWLDSITMWYVAIGAALTLSIVEVDDFGLWAGEAYRWGIAALFFVICRSVLRDWRTVRVVLWCIVAATLATWAFSFGQVITGNGPSHMFRGGALRVYAMFGTPNPLAAYIEFTVPIFLVLALLGIRQSFRERIGTHLWLASSLTAFLGLLVLALTQSRGGMIGFAAAMAVVFWVLPRSIRLTTIVIGVVLVSMISLTPVGQSQLHRFADVFDESTAPPGRSYDYDTGRGAVWGAAIRMAEDEPWTGVGAGEFDYHYREYTPSWYERFPLGQAHNGWLQMTAQSGLPGAVAFSGWVAATLLSLIGAARRSADQLSRALAIGALAVMVAFSVHSLVDYLNVLSLGLHLSAVAAIGLNLAPDPCVVTNARKRAGEVPDITADPLHTGIA